MKISRNKIFLLVITLELIILTASFSAVCLIKEKNIDIGAQAQEGSLTVVISREQYYYEDNTVLSESYIYWANLAGGGYLTLFGNTSDIISYAFWDSSGNLTEGDGITFQEDRILITPRTTEVYYQLYSVYYPDYFQDTNFIVIFDTFWAQFSYLSPEGEEVYAPVTYYNKQILPEGAGFVSYAPTDGSKMLKQGEETYGIEWSFEERAMDPFHEPFVYEITYTFDPIYLAYTEQMYQNQKQQELNESERNFIDLLRTYFRIIAFLAVILSVVAAIIGYLRARQKLKTKMDQARNMPKRMLKDIEAEIEPSKRVSSFFNAGFIILLLTTPLFMNTEDINLSSVAEESDNGVSIQGLTPLDDDNRNINYDTTIDLGKTGLAFETVIMELPYSVANFSVWANTNNVVQFQAFNRLGLQVPYQEFSDHYLIRNVDGYIRYEIIRPYTYYNNSDILVYLDYFWLNFYDYELQEFSRADISYTLIMPEGAILYSASPETILSLSQTPEGRRKVTFTDFDREIDPYHDLFSMQVTYSFIDVLDAIENQSARFFDIQVETELTQEQVQTLTRNVMFLAFLAIIAPILAFLLSYYVMRNRMMKKIKEEEQKHELLISVEEIQIESLNKAQDIDLAKEPWKAMLGGYWELLAYLSRYMPVSLLNIKEDMHEKIVRKYIPSYLITETLELLSTGRALSKSWEQKEQIYYNRSQTRDYLEAVMKLIEKMEKQRKESK